MIEPKLIEFGLKTISGTPGWVWVGLAYLLFLGIKATNQRIVYLPKLFIIPAIIIGIKCKTFINSDLKIWLFCVICLICGSLVGNRIAKHEKIEILNNRMQIRLMGNYSTLIILIIFFSTKYIFGYLEATNQALIHQLIAWETCISALFSGIFLGKALNYSRKCFYLRGYSQFSH